MLSLASEEKFSKQIEHSCPLFLKVAESKLTLSSDFISLIDDFVDGLSNFKSVRIHVFANFAFESLPVERSHILVLSAWWFFLLLCEDPTLQALKMDQTHCSFALASHNKWV